MTHNPTEPAISSREVEALHAFLKRSEAPEASAALRERVLGIPGAHPQPLSWRAFWPFESTRGPALALAAAALLGVFAEGWLPIDSWGAGDTALSSASSASDADVELSEDDDFARLAFADEMPLGEMPLGEMEEW